MMEERGAFHRGFRSRALHALYLIPILLGFRPLILKFQWIQFTVYSTGFLILLFLVIYSNQIPFIVYDSLGLHVLLEYREGREIHRFDEILGYRRVRKRSLWIFSLEHKPLKLRMSSRAVAGLIGLLEEKGIRASAEQDEPNRKSARG